MDLVDPQNPDVLANEVIENIESGLSRFKEINEQLKKN
jgi:hypothetical protein